MLLAGHFSVWAVSAAAATMQEKERDKARLDSVMPFVTARKVRVMLMCCDERCDDRRLQLDRVWSLWRMHVQQQRRLYTLAGAVRMASQSRALLSHLAFLRSCSRFKAVSSTIIARATAARRCRLVRICLQV